jgi:hypothetical protein
MGRTEGRTMPSPFPGMNPYLERAETWGGFHLQLIVGIQFQLVAQVDGCDVQLVARRYVHPPANPGDLPCTERRPVVTVRHRQSSELVTVIELLSPTSKCAGPHREEYLSARAELLASPIHFVEIDLLRAGPRVPVAGLPGCDYCALVRRAPGHEVEVRAWRMRHPFPVIAVPLRAGEPDAQLNLRAVLDRLYDGAGCRNYIYFHAPEPRLAPDDAAWAAQFLPAST